MNDWLIFLAIAVVWLVSSRFVGAKLTEDQRATERRIGWGYGYGAGYTDAAAGRDYDLTAPKDGRVRHLGAEETT